MKFNNAYSLILHLFDKDLLQGIDLGIRGDCSINSTIKDSGLLKILTEIFGEWRWGPGVSCEQGYYYFIKNEYGELGFDVRISSDILDSDGNPFEIEGILQILVHELGLNKIDAEESLEFQMVLDLELDYPDTKVSKFDLQLFEIYSNTIGDEIDLEIKNKLAEIDIVRLKHLIVDYLIKIHKKHHEINFTGFSLKIKSHNYIEYYDGIGHEFIDGLKEFFENYSLEYETE